MNDHDPFLQAIIAEPDDDAPRLVYSDWLEERGNPRGEFIRVQCALARPDGNNRRRAAMREREQALLAEHRKAWVKPLRGFGKLLRFRRGFVERMTITAEMFLRRGEALFRLAPIRAVRIRDIWGQMPAVALCPLLARLRELNLTNNSLDESDVHVLAGSPYLLGLTSLDLSFNAIGPGGARALVESSRLPQLTQLDLGAIFLGTRGAAILAGLPGLGRLTSLNLSFNSIRNPGLEALAGSPHLANLTILCLCQAEVSDAGAQAVAASPHLSHLTKLSLRRNDIGASGARALAGSTYLTRLARLDLAGNPLNQEAQNVLKRRFGSRVLFG